MKKKPVTKSEVSKVEPTSRVPAIKQIEPGKISVAVESLEDLLQSLGASTGTKAAIVGLRMTQMVSEVHYCGSPLSADERLREAISTLAEIAPQNVTEAMLAAQMIATNNAALRFMANATSSGQTVQGAESNVLRATRLMRLHLDQIEAMQKLRGKSGQQKVTVEHVHVYEGGQAIVGTVEPVTRGEGHGTRDRRKTL